MSDGEHPEPSEAETGRRASGQPVPPEAMAGIWPEPEHRLSPLTMVTAPLSYLRNFILPIGVAVVAGSFNPWVLGSAAVAITGMLVTGFITWRTFRYQVGTERLEIRKGLVNRSRRSIPLERIRGVDVTSHLLHRMLGLAVVNVEAAAGGGEKEEGKLDAVTAAEAERLRRVLLHRRAVLRGDASDTAAEAVLAPTDEARETAKMRAEAPDSAVYFTMPRSWYLYAVLSLGYLLTPFVALATLLGFTAQIIGDIGPRTEVGDALYTVYLWLEGIGRSALAMAAGAVLAVLVLLMPLFAVVSYTIAYWAFTLRRSGESLVAERGLFTRQSVTLEHRRIRGHELLDNPLERLCGAVRLRAIVTGLGESATRTVLLPAGPRTRVMGVVEQALTPFGGSLIRHPRAALARRLIRAVSPFFAAAVAAAAFGLYWPAALLAIVALAAVPLGVDRYRALGHGYDGRQVSVRSGSLRREQAVVQDAAVIGWTWSQTLLQRRAGLADLKLAVGAGDGGYTAIDAGFGESVSFAESVTPDMVRPFLLRPGPAEESVEARGR
ncbi:MAG: PH domain-containing protein [Nocardiopsaceae bacterium]|nr:PH domain-containing protein [Nocardiopsaceae bacterium]